MMIGNASLAALATLTTLATLGLAILTAAPTRASDAMTFTLGRLDRSPDCGAPCAQFIVADGQIEQFSSFSYLLARKRTGDRDLPVLLTSPGGYIAGADRIARVWRKLGVTVIVVNVVTVCEKSVEVVKGRGKTTTITKTCLDAPNPSGVQAFRLAHSGAKCASACTLMVAGATRRIAVETARIGLHRSHIDPDSEAARVAKSFGAPTEQVIAQVEKNFLESLESLGIDPELSRRASKTAANDMEWITPEEARRYHLFNANTDDAALTEELRAALATLR